MKKLQKAAEIENKEPDPGHFVDTQEFNRLMKVIFDVKMKEPEQSLANKTEVRNTRGLDE